ncbi:glycoside hydrolase [Auricularia subglabra TFB-10046 SS5]|nr:glycoside hydrolase [Auricularia subglabra TFB-10046 SS5]
MASTLLAVAGVIVVASAASKGFTGKPVIAGYWPSYASDLLRPEAIQYHQFTHIDWFVAETTPTYELDFGGNEDLIKPVIERAHRANVTVSLSIGGWTGSRYFSDLVANASGRAQYARSIAGYLQKYGFDGADIDWESPAVQTIGCNTVRPHDSDNLLGFLKDLRAYAPNARLSAAVGVTGIAGPNGETYERINRLAVYLDYIVRISGALAVKLYTENGFPAEKILLGVPSYAYPYVTASSTLVPRTSGNSSSLAYQSRTQDVPEGGATSAGPGTDPCGVETGPAPMWLFRELVETGRISGNTTVGGNGFTRYFDECSRTPFLFNPTTRDFIAYDDPQSYGAKAAFARQHGLAGVNMFDLTGDTQDSKLIHAVRAQLVGESAAQQAGLTAFTRFLLAGHKSVNPA